MTIDDRLELAIARLERMERARDHEPLYAASQRKDGRIYYPPRHLPVSRDAVFGWLMDE